MPNKYNANFKAIHSGLEFLAQQVDGLNELNYELYMSRCGMKVVCDANRTLNREVVRLNKQIQKLKLQKKSSRKKK